MYALGAAKPKPTVEELESDLEATKKSHAHCERALTNMSVVLSDAMDRIAGHEELKRKTELETNKCIDGLSAKVGDLNEKLLAAEKRAETAEKYLAIERQKNAPKEGPY